MKATQSKESQLRLHSKQHLAVTKLKLYLENTEQATGHFLDYCGA